MDNNALAEYVAKRNQSGVSKSVLFEELRAVGWSEEESENAYRAGLVISGVPIPSEEKNRKGARKSSTVDIVINFFSFILLGIVVTALGILLFGVIDKLFPDVLDGFNSYAEASTSSSIHYAISALIIGFPLYYFSMRLWFRTFREDEGRTESKLSQWLTYLVLLITAVTIVGDLITVVFTLLQGEITVRFFLKALTILIIAGIVFGFYYLERRKIQYHVDIPRTIFLSFGRVVTGFLLFSIVLGFFVSGSPTTERNRTLDRIRVEHLSTLASCIEDYARTFGNLPKTLTDLETTNQFSYCKSSMYDPETRSPYEYKVVTASRTEGLVQVGDFELCANFSLASNDRTIPLDTSILKSIPWEEHSAGRNCDTMKVQLLIPTSSSQQPEDITPTLK